MLLRVSFFNSVRLVGPALLLLAVSGCAGYNARHAEVYDLLASGNAPAALDRLEGRYHSGRNEVLHRLDKAMLNRMVGRYAESNRQFELAKQEMNALDAFSVTENIASVTLNENARTYAGQPYERLLVHAYKALNYIESGRIDSARVEMLQADDKLREWAAAGDLEGIEAGIFVRCLSGIVYELNDEPDEALIAYRKAYRGLKELALPVPAFLQRDLLRLTEWQGLDDEHAQYRADFSVGGWPDMEQLREQAEVILIYHEGLLPRMQQETVHVYSPQLSHNVIFAVPYYPAGPHTADHARLTVGERSAETAIIEDVDFLARERLRDRLPGIQARTVARIVAKKLAANEAAEEHILAGLVVDIAGMMSEQTDTRSWTSLPATIQIARLPVPPGEHRIEVSGHGAAGRTVALNAGQKVVISLHEVAGTLMPADTAMETEQ